MKGTFFTSSFFASVFKLFPYQITTNLKCLYVFVGVHIYVKEDMNLNEDRKAPLREKDLSTKREMVVQYISATTKSVSNICYAFCLI